MKAAIWKVLIAALVFSVSASVTTAQEVHGELYDESYFVGRWAADGVIFAYDVHSDISLTEWVFPLEYVFAADGTGYAVEGGKERPLTWSVMFRSETGSIIGGLLTITEKDTSKVSFVGFAGANHFSETTLLRDGEVELPFHYQYYRVE